MRKRFNYFFEFRSTLGRARDAAHVLANRHGWDSRVTIIGTRHFMIFFHWHPSDRAECGGTDTARPGGEA